MTFVHAIFRDSVRELQLTSLNSGCTEYAQYFFLANPLYGNLQANDTAQEMQMKTTMWFDNTISH